MFATVTAGLTKQPPTGGFPASIQDTQVPTISSDKGSNPPTPMPPTVETEFWKAAEKRRATLCIL